MISAPLHNEKLLLQQLAEGRQDAFTSLYDHYNHLVSQVILKFVKQKDLAEDLTQDIFLKIWKQHAQLQHVQSFYAYLVGVTRNHCIDVLKKASRLQEAKTELIRYAMNYRIAETDSIIEKEYIRQLYLVYESLPPQTKEIFTLVKEQGKSYDEVAALLGVSRSAVNKHIVRSNKAFQNAIEGELGIPLSLLLLLLSIKN